MEELIDRIRRKELVILRKSYLVRNVIDSFNTSSPFMVALFSFATYVLSSPSHELTPQVEEIVNLLCLKDFSRS
ncbi:hypothetical protein NECAME_14678 [Necator americanus]|uniref:Uncharacterized protein n=1 Tax=Necator americanus TaxID=51031 RepID=W2SPD3_NECAM|nr:hypothetical protein NECAME_14678 [Necator americanus]ETN70562.1 hypothetical protein NECAME_14678 [Necator americanus]